MKPYPYAPLVIFLITGCGLAPQPSSIDPDSVRVETTRTLTEARQGFQTKLTGPSHVQEEVPEPPDRLFRTVRYESPVGKLAAYLTPDPKDGKKHPAIIWITGGDYYSIGESSWTAFKPSNDQSASAYRKAGIVMMRPSLRGGNDNPGRREGFLGEVDDVVAAAEFLSKQEYVDPNRIYLGGHSTGGTLALLVAECSDRFRAVFSFGPTADIRTYGHEYVTCDRSNTIEIKLRSPAYWFASVKNPTFVLEGAVQGNTELLMIMEQMANNPKVKFIPVDGANHFSLLAPTNRLIANKILRDTGPECNVTLTENEVNAANAK